MGLIRWIHLFHPHYPKQEALSEIFQHVDYILSRFLGNAFPAPVLFHHEASSGQQRHHSAPDFRHFLHSSLAFLIHQRNAQYQSSNRSHNQLFGTCLWNHHGPFYPERSSKPEDHFRRDRYPWNNTGRNSERSPALVYITS